MRGMIFDCDGVLVDSREANVGYYNLLRKLLGLPPMSRQDEEYVQMASNEGALARIIPKSLLSQLPKIIAQVDYMQHVMPLFSPSDGLLECLNALRAKGLLLGICTNRGDSTYDLLERFGVTEYFSEVMTVNNARPKPAPDGLEQILNAWGVDGNDVAFVGDSRLDQEAAQNAGVRFWAFAAPDLNAERHIANFSELQSLTKNL